MSTEPAIRIRDLHKSYGLTPVLRGIDLDVHAGEVLCLIGPSGSGKSTLLRCINRMERHNRGLVEVHGELIGHEFRGDRVHELSDRRVLRQRADIGMVFQHFNLFQHMTVLENIIEGPMHVRKLSRRDAIARANHLLAQVGLAGRESAYPRQLSGGQQQRIAIARALAMEPRVMLFDEPTSALDPELVGEVLDVIRTLADSGMTMLIVTHEILFARDIANNIAFMDDGRIVEYGPPDEVLLAPRHDRTRAFLARSLRSA